jgi:hypothetical protein
MRIKYRQNKKRFLLEWLRLRGGLRNTYSFTKSSPSFQTTYTDINDGTEKVRPASGQLIHRFPNFFPLSGYA